MSKQEEIEKLILKIKQAYKAGKFLNYIEYIRFPFYKNLEENTKIGFDFPLTIFTGQNGSGKSSTLHSVYGAPDGYSTGNFWFSTKVDPIEEGQGNPNCFIYGYKGEKGDISEVLKTRIRKLNNPEYWEPSRPLKKYGMEILEGKRNSPIKKEVRYLDFRSELSAYDKYFYFAPFRITKTLKSKQDVIRKYSHYLKDIIDNNNDIKLRGITRNQPSEELVNEELVQISKILGKDYTYCKLIRHSLFASDGLTIFFKTSNQNYSEAFAGRGEFAVVKLVHEVLNVPDYSLIILDEPEVSLHPGAQEELKIFLLNQVLKKKLQVIISTHSPKIVEYFPDNSIKLFYQKASGRFGIKNECHYIEAFNFIGHETTEGKKIIIVEDIASRVLIEKVLESMGTRYKLIFKVKYYPGGGEEILKKAVTYSEENENYKFLLLDGDKKKEKVDPQKITKGDLEDFGKIGDYLIKATGIEFNNLPFRIDSSSKGGGDVNQKISSSFHYLKFLFNNLDFLPSQTPEELIWNEAYARDLLKVREINDVTFNSSFKSNLIKFTESFFGDKSQASVLSTYKLFIENFIKKADNNYKSVISIIEKFYLKKID